MRLRILSLALISCVVMAMDSNSSKAARDPKNQGGRLVRGADLVLLGGKIWTGEPMARPGVKDPTATFAQAVAILDGRIAAVGTDEQIEPYVSSNTQVINLHGRFAMPGFIDSHVHFMDGSFKLLEVNLKHVHSKQEFVDQIAAKARLLPAGRWLLGGDWDEEAWPDGQLPTRWMIDEVTKGIPVYIDRYDGHAGLANSLALKMAGITKETPAPTGGVIVRDPATGEPTGVLKDAAQDLITRGIPNPTDAEAEQALRAGLAEARRVGVTSVENMNLGTNTPYGTFQGELLLLRRAKHEGWLTCRFYEIIPILDWERLRDIGISRKMGDEFIKLCAVKAFADGSVGSRTAWMFKPYIDDPNNFGLATALMDPPTKMEALAREANAAGIQICIHAIGTRAISEVLDIYQSVGGSDPASNRFRIEHAQHLRPEDFARFARLGVIASMQPYHAIDDGRWVEKRIGPKRARWSYAWRSMLDAGVPLAFGTDWPVAPLNPLLSIYAAVTRETLDGKNPHGWFPEEKITLNEALRAYTAGSAYAAFEENEKGTIAHGKLGDIVVLSDDLFSIAPEKIKDVYVDLTILGGKVVYDTQNP